MRGRPCKRPRWCSGVTFSSYAESSRNTFEGGAGHPSGCLPRRQQSLNFLHDARDLFLICQRHHEELVALMETDNAVREEPDAFEQGIAAEQEEVRSEEHTSEL